MGSFSVELGSRNSFVSNDLKSFLWLAYALKQYLLVLILS